jgi:phosphate transport system permease protein
MIEREIKKRKLISRLVLLVAFFCALWGLFWLFFIIFDVLRHGLSSINLSLFLEVPTPPGEPGGGLKHAFIGHLLITLVSVILGIPLGILGGTFLAEYGRNFRFSRFISFLADTMISVPAIIVGVFVYAIMVKPLGHFNGWSGGVALAIIMLPVIIRTTEEMLSLVPWTLREAAFALGAPYHKVIWQVVYPSVKTGLFTGCLLAIAREIGEAAPLLFTSFNNNFLSYDMSGPMATLTVTIFVYVMGPYDYWHAQAWGAAFVITLTILLINLTARLMLKKGGKSDS